MYISISDISVDYNLQPDNISMLIQSNFAIWDVIFMHKIVNVRILGSKPNMYF